MRRSMFSNDMYLFILNNAANRTTKDLTEMLNVKFKTSFTCAQVHNYKSRKKIANGLNAADTTRGCSEIYTPQIKEFILNNYKGRTTQELTALVNKEFNTLFREGQLRAYKSRNRLSSGVVTTFKKGQASYNKGKKMPPEVYERCKATMFKKGSTPPNKLPVGSEIKDSYGYWKVKVGEPDKWEFKHRLIYEKYYNMKIQKGDMVTFLDGNKDNLNIKNLALLTNEENLYLLRNKLRSEHSEITKTGINIAKLDLKIKERMNECVKT